MPNESLKDVLSQITIKHVMQTERRIRRWDEGRRYDLLRCYHTLIQVTTDKQYLISLHLSLLSIV